MDIFRDEIISDLLFAPEYLPDVLHWLKKQPTENGHISKDSAEKILAVISYPCWQRFLQTFARPCELSKEDLVSCEYKLLTETGLARIEAVRMLGQAGKQYNLSITETARQMFGENNPFLMDQEKRRRSLIHRFAAAAVNLYGVVEKEFFISLFNQYSEGPTETEHSGTAGSFESLSVDELETVITPYSEFNIDVLLAENYLANRMVDADNLAGFFSNVSSDNYCLLPMDALLPYADPEYFERTPQIADFLWMLQEKVPGMTEGSIKLVQLLFAPCYLSDWPQMIEVELCPLLKPLSGEDQREIAELFVRAKRSVRSWRFRGYSEDEAAPEGEEREKDVGEFMRVLGEC